MKFIIVVIMLISSLIRFSNSDAGKIYIWTDENGVEHITDTPPPKNVKPKETINLNKNNENFDTYNPKKDSHQLPSKFILEKERDRLGKCLELSKEKLVLLNLSQELLREEHQKDLNILNAKGQRKIPSPYLLRKEKSLEKRRDDINFKIKSIDLKFQELKCPK